MEVQAIAKRDFRNSGKATFSGSVSLGRPIVLADGFKSMIMDLNQRGSTALMLPCSSHFFFLKDAYTPYVPYFLTPALAEVAPLQGARFPTKNMRYVS
jgi:hypothetical protein